MKKICLLALALGFIGCGKPDPYNAVRDLRRGYELKVDLTVSDAGEATYEISARNLTGKTDLHEVTTIVRILDKDQQPVWTKQVEVPVEGVGPYATAKAQFKDQVGNIEYEYYDVQLAPDDKDSPFKTYQEFMRVTPR